MLRGGETLFRVEKLGSGNVLVTGQGAAGVFGTETLITDTEQVQFRIASNSSQAPGEFLNINLVAVPFNDPNGSVYLESSPFADVIDVASVLPSVLTTTDVNIRLAMAMTRSPAMLARTSSCWRRGGHDRWWLRGRYPWL